MDALKILNGLQARAAEREARRAARRDFLRTAGGFGAGVAGTVVLTACGGGTNTSVAQTSGPSDEEILNFALNLEYLEAQFYSYAATGAGLPASMLSGTGTQGTVTPGQKANLSSQLVINYAAEIAQDEVNHVAFLRNALGSSAVAMPSIDVSASPTGAFSTAAQAAGLVPAGTAFNPYASDEAFLLGAYIFEDVGVTAYHGAATLISNKTYLDAAAGILAVEAYHAGLIRTALYAMGLANPAPSINPFTATAAISAARAKLDGTNNDDIGIGTPTAATIVDANSSSIAFDRTTAQVLNIVYLNPAAVTMGGFFPAGVNGSINTSG
jgi:hypothetical protein